MSEVSVKYRRGGQVHTMSEYYARTLVRLGLVDLVPGPTRVAQGEPGVTPITPPVTGLPVRKRPKTRSIPPAELQTPEPPPDRDFE